MNDINEARSGRADFYNSQTWSAIIFAYFIYRNTDVQSWWLFPVKQERKRHLNNIGKMRPLIGQEKVDFFAEVSARLYKTIHWEKNYGIKVVLLNDAQKLN